MKTYLGYQEGDEIYIQVPYSIRELDKDLIRGKVYKGVVENTARYNLGIIFQSESRTRYTSLISPTAFNHEGDWIVCTFEENLKKILE